MLRYGQFCPVAKAAEIFADRWTPLIVRELCFGPMHLRRPAVRHAADLAHHAGRSACREMADAEVISHRTEVSRVAATSTGSTPAGEDFDRSSS